MGKIENVYQKIIDFLIYTMYNGSRLWSGGDTVGKTGRPRLENPRSEGVFIRLTKDEHAEVVKYAREHNLTITKTLVDGFKALQEKQK